MHDGIRDYLTYRYHWIAVKRFRIGPFCGWHFSNTDDTRNKIAGSNYQFWNSTV